MKLVREFFIKHTKYSDIDIGKIEEIHFGYSNKNYFIELKNGRQFQIRISKGINKNHVNELKALKLCNNSDFIYLNCKGDAIKKWIEGNTINDWNDDLLIKIGQKLKKLHKISPTNLTKHNYRKKLFVDLNNKYLDIYLVLIKKYENDNLVLSHNDLNPQNIIEKNNIPHFIDFEYSCANSLYWDIANLINESNLNSWQQEVLIHSYGDINIQKLNDYLFIQLFFAYAWAINYPQKNLVNNYKNELKDKLIKFKFDKLSTKW